MTQIDAVETGHMRHNLTKYIYFHLLRKVSLLWNTTRGGVDVWARGSTYCRFHGLFFFVNYILALIRYVNALDVNHVWTHLGVRM